MDYKTLTSKVNYLAYKTYKEGFSLDDFNKNRSNNSISFLHLNIRSFNKNFNELLIYLDQFKFDLIILSEIWSNFEMSTDRFLEDYHYFYTTNKVKKSGGVVIYVKTCFNTTGFDLSIFPTDDK